MKLYYQGIKGAYSHQVAEILKEYLLKQNYKEPILVEGVFSFKYIFESLDRYGGIGVIPIENSYAGSVHQNLYLMRDYNIKILAEYYLPVKHCLASFSDSIDTIKKVYSHPQALMQCENFLKKYNLQPIEFSDTARSAEYVSKKKDKSIAAICSEYAANLYGLNILKKNINDHPNNITRFLFISRDIDYKNYGKIFDLEVEKQSIIFRVKDQPAILFKCLGAFATRGINLTKIESIPSKKGEFEYLFWIDFKIKDISKEDISGSIEELKFFTKEIINLGTYGRITS